MVPSSAAPAVTLSTEMVSSRAAAKPPAFQAVSDRIPSTGTRGTVSAWAVLAIGHGWDARDMERVLPLKDDRILKRMSVSHVGRVAGVHECLHTEG